MRPPSILDVLRAIRDVGPAHPEVRAWWYAPVRRERPVEGEAGEAVEVVVEMDGSAADLAGIGGDLADRLHRGPVSVRAHRGAGEARRLYRLLSRGKAVTIP
jgi:hypothetical protein